MGHQNISIFADSINLINEQTETLGNFGQPMSILRDRVKPIDWWGRGCEGDYGKNETANR